MKVPNRVKILFANKENSPLNKENPSQAEALERHYKKKSEEQARKFFKNRSYLKLTLSHDKHKHDESHNPERLRPKILDVISEGYGISDLVNDTMSGFTVSIVALPLAMAFAIAANISPIHGIYTAIIVGFISLFFTGSRYQISGPSGAFAIITYSIVYRYGYDGLLVTLILTGILLAIAGLFRVGSLIKFIPYPVTVGFALGISLIIGSQQFASFLGLPLTNVPPEFFEKVFLFIQHIDKISYPTLAFSLFTMAIMYFSPKITKKIPAPAVGVGIGILVVAFFDLPITTIKDQYGAIPQTLPTFYLPPINLEIIQMHFPDAITLTLLISIESLLTSVVADSCTSDKHYSNMELISQGVGNIFAGLFGGIPSTGATSRTISNINAGAVSPISSVMHSVFLVTFIFFFPDILSSIPLPSLSVILIFVAYNMLDTHAIRIIFASSKLDGAIFFLTFFLTITFDLTTAIYIGVTFASLAFMQRMSTHTSILSDEHGQSLHPLGADFSKQVNLPDNIRIIHIDGPLFFGVADRFQSALSSLGEKPKVYILHMKHVTTMDSTGVHAVEVFILRSKEKGYKVVISSPTEEVIYFLKRINMIDKLGKENICDNLDDAIKRAYEKVQELEQETNKKS